MDVDIVDLEYLDVEPPTLDAGTPDVTIWSDGADGPVAFGATRGDWHWLRFVGVGTYRFPVRPSGLTIAAGVVPEPSVDHALLVDSYYRSIVPLALQAYGLEALHGSAVALPGGVVAMCADRETGKSTIAYSLKRRGHDVVADDAAPECVIQIERKNLVLHFENDVLARWDGDYFPEQDEQLAKDLRKAFGPNLAKDKKGR